MALTSLRVRGPFRGPSGYDHHVREFVRELVRQGIEVELMELPRWGPIMLPPEMRDPWFETLNRRVDARVILQFCMPHQALPLEGIGSVNYTMFEADRISQLWVERAAREDMIILPTESSRQAWLKSGVPAGKLRLCPLGIDPHRFSGTAPPLPLRDASGEPLDRYRRRFLNISEVGSRKNLAGLVAAWLSATTREDDAVLILKLGSYIPGWREVLERELAQVQEELGKRLEEAAPVHMIHDLFADEQMPGFYTTATHYISMSRGEGWDLPMVEAAASGLTLIAPNHSAYTAYLDASCAHLLPARETPVRFPPGSQMDLLFQNAYWWEPDREAAAAVIRAIIDGTAPEKTSPSPRIRRDLNWENATRRLITLLDEAETRRTRAKNWRLPLPYRRG